ncbi:MAG: glycosyltransferase, partial [Bdellovibrionales bacterium]|nr:glycosyltransferase [Bdellovibrionales bacterium]
LQEAGNRILSDGSTLAYGRGANPWQVEFLYQREVDYCSGVCLFTPTDLFRSIGGFDDRFAPAYYEDVDYCVRVRMAGKKVIYDPACMLYHREHGSAGAVGAARQQGANRDIFVRRHQGSEVLHAPDRPRALFIDDRLPLNRYGSGFPRTQKILQALESHGYAVTLYCLRQESLPWGEYYDELPRSLHCEVDGAPENLGEFLRLHLNACSLVIVSRPQNLELLQGVRDDFPQLFHQVPVIYDAEALIAPREIAKAKLHRGVVFSEADERHVIDTELGLLKDVAYALTVSEAEAFTIETEVSIPTSIVSHEVSLLANPPTFCERSGIVFVGPLLSIDAPNADALKWFLEFCLPILKRDAPEISVRVIGECIIPEFLTWSDPQVCFLGYQPELKTLLGKARVCIAANRFAAGIPLKVIEAAACGTPSVVTPLLAQQLSWEDGRELLVAERPQEFVAAIVKLYRDESCWCSLHQAAREKVASDYSATHFLEGLQPVFDLVQGASA